MIGQNIAILSSHWLQAYFEKMKLPFTGSGAEETRFGLNKVTDRCPHHQIVLTLARQFESCEVFRAEGLPTLRPVLLTNMKQVTEQLVEKVRQGAVLLARVVMEVCRWPGCSASPAS